MAEIHKLPHALIVNLPVNVQGTFQICGDNAIGIMTLNTEEGTVTVDVGHVLGRQILALIPVDDTPPKTYA